MSGKLFTLLLLFSALALSSCESDLTTSNPTLEKKLILNPPHLEGEQYMSYTFKARVTNVAASDVRFYWDFDEGQGFQDFKLYDDVAEYTFIQPKVHYIRVKAFDYFTDSLIGFDSIRADIRAPSPFVEVSPKVIDTTLVMKPDGTMAEYLYFNLRTSLPDSVLRTEWDFGDGSEITSYNSHRFMRPGSFVVRVKVFEKTGAYLGSDSATVVIHMPMFGYVDIANAKNITVWFNIDSSHPVATEPLFVNPFGLGISTKKDPSSGISNFKFNVFFKDTGIVSQDTQFVFPKKLYLDTIVGELSADLKSVKMVAVSVNDTGRVGITSNAKLRYSYTLNNLELLSVTSTEIVYRTQYPTMSEFARDIYFNSVRVKNLPRGILASTDSPPAPKAGAYGLVVFDR